MTEAIAPVEALCCYAHEDEAWLRKLEIHLSLLKRQGLISLWHDQLIAAGSDWAKTIDTHLETASVVLLLVSADFLASDYCYSIEMQRALERHEAGEALVIPILVRPVDWAGAPFAHLQALPSDAKPLSAWQDEDTALASVAAGIRRVIEDIPLLAASTSRSALPAIWNIPYPRNPFFLGRDDELTRLRHYLQAGQATALSQPQAISGLGGIGKTQLALEYAYHYHQDYQIVLWARAESTEALVSSYVTIASLLRLPEREAKEQNIIVQAVKAWLQKHHGYLLILDNADELTLLPDFLPSTLGGHLLLTTRAAMTGRLAHRLEIETLLPEHGALFLLRRGGLIAPDATLEQASQEERELALSISHELGGLPLALDQAGAYLEETGTDLASFWQIYQQHRANLLQERGGLVDDHPAPVTTTWSLSFQRVEEKNPAAAELLRMCAFLAPDAIPEELLTMGASSLGALLAPVAADIFRLNQAIEVLRAYSLVRRDSREKKLSIHRLVQAVLKDRLSETERRSLAERAMLTVNAVFPFPEHSVWPQCERLLVQALAAIQVIEQYQIISEEAERLLHDTALYLQDHARYAEAELLYQRSLRIAEHLFGLEHPLTAASLNGLANLYKAQGQYQKAAPLYLQALRIIRRRLGKHPQIAIALTNLAIIYEEQGQYRQAEPLHRQALQIMRQYLDKHSRKIIANTHWANFSRHQDIYAEAEPRYQRALRQLLGSERSGVTAVLINLANLYSSQDKYAEAQSLYQRALEILEQQSGPEHLDLFYPLINLAILYEKHCKYTEAQSLYQRALRILEQELGFEHFQVSYPLNGLANIYERQGKYAEAEPLYQRALRIRDQALGAQHPATAVVMNNLAWLQQLQGNYEESRVWYERALIVYEQALGARHPQTTETRERLIALLHIMGQHKQAAQLEAGQSEP